MLNYLNSNFKSYEFAIGITLLLQVLAPKLFPIGLILTAISVIFLASKKEVKRFTTRTHFLFLAFYATYLIGMFFSQDIKEAGHVLESKLSLALFPLLFMFIPKREIAFKIPILFYSSALVLSFLISIIDSTICFTSRHTFSCFISSDFSTIHHPTYMAIYYLVGILLLFFVQSISKRVRYSLILLFSLGYLLCMSLSAILFLGLLIAVVGFIWFKQKIGVVKSIGLVSVMLMGLIAIINLSKDTISDVEYTYNSLKTYLQSPEDYVKHANRYLVGNEERLVLWTVSAQAIIEQPMGYGTGNIDLVIGNKLRSYGLDELAARNFNPHNQYLQTWIETGIFGVLILIGLFFTLLKSAWKHKNWTLFIFVFAFAFNALFESVLQRQSGIVLFAIISFILLLSAEKRYNFLNNQQP